LNDSPTTVITGGAEGIGFAIAQLLAADGERIALIDDEPAVLSHAIDTLAAAGAGEVFAVPAQLTDPQSIAEAFNTISEHWPSINGLINTSRAPVAEVEDLLAEHVWQVAVDARLIAVVRCVRFALPLLSSARWGRIVNVVETPVGVSASESAVTAALLIFSKRLARQVRRHGILVNVVSPAALLTGGEDDVVLATGSESDDVFDTYISISERAQAPLTLAATATAANVAETAAHCASNRNRLLTGQHIIVDSLTEHVSRRRVTANVPRPPWSG
jgi:NAD(P)-dependent dehydrogenase (short-subunit alcohol dehydrogenase family)